MSHEIEYRHAAIEISSTGADSKWREVTRNFISDDPQYLVMTEEGSSNCTTMKRVGNREVEVLARKWSIHSVGFQGDVIEQACRLSIYAHRGGLCLGGPRKEVTPEAYIRKYRNVLASAYPSDRIRGCEITFHADEARVRKCAWRIHAINEGRLVMGPGQYPYEPTDTHWRFELSMDNQSGTLACDLQSLCELTNRTDDKKVWLYPDRYLQSLAEIAYGRRGAGKQGLASAA